MTRFMHKSYIFVTRIPLTMQYSFRTYFCHRRIKKMLLMNKYDANIFEINKYVKEK